ncbi:TA system antitoxin ParD family protein [Sagittula stellata]|uniref:Uncharacterized protein n=1 Tax=Sagittula stellata (strain ATCC 700073 / DSM 11524 / E-37) TaxID=388399 RepID=A3K7W0_SAGS3|nr:hypothetical protein [Sagittula stellata]EBA06732.1 hypothetical protein SSE37_02555 [Sagittula stellata E-37]
MEDARVISELQSRSLAGQITHRARTGRAIERFGTFDHASMSSLTLTTRGH